ncbi:hypothetical protein [Pleomorphomonas sp. JP5]|uniref:hypothetical protein n=1 Tax=Pleomorphomonas sp. JP5 TaxID=2942998 RepID=UPI0020447417|nr:hypothetical protein [Pleomorphomonas sp. JP5]MCM5557349.1 hypothetical protein [Pleomorphomonas sp. JP5]
MALAVLLGGFQAEAGSVAMTADGLVDLSKFDELEKAVIVKTAENMVVESIEGLRDEVLAGKDGSLKYKKLFAFSYVLLGAEAHRAGLAPLAQANMFKAQILTEYIRGETDLKKTQHYDQKTEEKKQQYFDEVIARNANKTHSSLTQDWIDAHARPIAEDILAIAKEKALGK